MCIKTENRIFERPSTLEIQYTNGLKSDLKSLKSVQSLKPLYCVKSVQKISENRLKNLEIRRKTLKIHEIRSEITEIWP